MGFLTPVYPSSQAEPCQTHAVLNSHNNRALTHTRMYTTAHEIVDNARQRSGINPGKGD